MSPEEAKRTDGAKKTDKKYIFARLWKYLAKHKPIIALCCVLVLASNLLALWGPSLSGKAIDAIGSVAGGVDFGTVAHYTTLMIVFYVISGVMSYFLSALLIKLSRKVVYEMRRDVFNRLSTLPVGFFDTRQTGDIISVISYDIDTVNASLSDDLLQIVRSIITVIGSLIMMIRIKPILVLIFLVTVPVSIIFSRYITKKVRPLFRKRSRKLGELNGYAEEMIDGQKVTKAYNREETVIAGFDKKNDEAVEAYTIAEYYGTLMGPSVNFINNISLTLVSVFGAILYIGGGIGLGDISSFVLYSRKFSGPINEVANIFGELQSAFAAAERVFRLIDEEPEKQDAVDAEVLTEAHGDVGIHDVEFGYIPERTIIRNFNLNAESGSLVAIVGPTGAGKTTIINLLMRFYDVNSGEITIDDKNIYSLTRDSLRRAYTMVLQETWLFHGTIFENIAYAKEDATMEEVVAAAKAAHIHSYIMRLPEGYNTVLSDNGTSISKGQKQLMTIARAMLLNSHMLILDEATSNVDTRTEMMIQAAMRDLMKGRTCFVIAHRLSTIRNADLILVMRDGSIVEHGRHEELLELGGFYSELYYSQFEVY
ncbi:MAG: ABC transporter ATP-binding protein [Christensenellaceae bacterium]|nr:ABC transporter ATP-binding protein [Christensenellaceae bacterium]